MIKDTKTKLQAKVRVGEDIRKIHDKDNIHNFLIIMKKKYN